ncbi:MAG: hypothetical protein COA90_05720 [Gammaproteobacteria bacterium]|nr:MAG: hypothetical protein COA90_05720 [Gammaproteobacteria bacterium]
MDLLQLRFKKISTFVRCSFMFSSACLLVACAATAPVQKEIASTTEVIQAPVEQEVEKIDVETLPLTPELVYYVLMAEIAGQRGEISLATELYNKASNSVSSPLLARRSTQVAHFTRDSVRINRALTRWLDVDPDNADIYLIQLPFLIKQADFNAVIRSINKAVTLAPEIAKQILAQAADNLSEGANPEQALKVLTSIELYKKNQSDAVLIHAQLAEFYKQYSLALVEVNKVLKLEPTRENALILKSEILQRSNQGKQAIKLLAPLANNKDASHEVLFAYGKLLGENGQVAEARKIFEQLSKVSPDNEEVIFALGLLALEEKDGSAAKGYFSQLLSKETLGHQASYFMGLALELEKDIDGALVWFASVPQGSGRFEAAQTRYIRLLTKNGELEKARLHLKLLRKEHPAQAAQYYIFEGSFLRENDQNQAALQLYTDALLEFPEHLELLYGRAMVAESLDRLALFEDDLNKILQMEPNNSVILNALGYTLTDRTNRHTEALVLIQRALEITPDEPFYLDSLGWVYFRMDDLNKAELYLRQAIAIQSDPEFLVHLGEVLWMQNKQAEAKRVWNEAGKKDKDNRLLNETLRRFGQ